MWKWLDSNSRIKAIKIMPSLWSRENISNSQSKITLNTGTEATYSGILYSLHYTIDVFVHSGVKRLVVKGHRESFAGKEFDCSHISTYSTHNFS